MVTTIIATIFSGCMGAASRWAYLDGEPEVCGAYLTSLCICVGLGICSAFLGAP
jgi:hypothetical protein